MSTTSLSTTPVPEQRPAPVPPSRHAASTAPAPRTVETIAIGGVERRRLQVPRPFSRLLGVAVVLALWQFASSTGSLDPDVIGAPATIWSTFSALVGDGSLGAAITTSLGRVAVGLTVGVLVGTALAVITGLSRIGEDLLDAPVQMLRTVPFAGLIPLLIVWLGVGEAPKVVLIALACVFPIYLNLTAGIRGADQHLVEAADTLGLSRAGKIVHVVLPGALPQFLVGLRVSLGVSWLALVFAEQISAVDGIGYLMTTAQQLLDSNVIVVCLLVYAVLGLLADLIVRALERTLLVWRPSAGRA